MMGIYTSFAQGGDNGGRKAGTCSYCKDPADTPGQMYKAVCDRHHQLMILIWRLEKRGLPVSAESLVNLLQRQNNEAFSITAEEIPGLLAEVMV